MRFIGRTSAEEGATLVEFALIVPLLLLLIIVILDLGRAVNAYVTVSNASREGARYASVHPTASPSAIVAAVKTRSVPLDASQLTVTATYYDGTAFRAWPPPASSPKPTAVPVRVQTTYSWSSVTFILGQFMASRNFTTSSTMDTIR
ncbi:MAG: pilus assembly protein [Chloroflexota bacterium]|nr:pilus assembly protein [Chloroflexota bacterium]